MVSDAVAKPREILKMSYLDFYHEVSERDHIVPTNWPLRKFCSPHQLGLVACRVMYGALAGENPRTLFRKLSDSEWKTFQTAVLQRNTSMLDPSLLVSFDILFGAAVNTTTDPASDSSANPLPPLPEDPAHIPPLGHDPSIPLDPTLLEQPVIPTTSPVVRSTQRVTVDRGAGLGAKKVRAKRWDAGLTMQQRAEEQKRREEKKEEERKIKAMQRETARRQKAEAAKLARLGLNT